MAGIANVDARLVFAKVFSDALTNIFFFGCGAAAIIFVATYLSWTFGFVLFILFSLVTVASVLHQILVVGTGAVYFFGMFTGKMKGESGLPKEGVSLGGATCVQLVELLIMLGYTWGIYRVLYP